MAAATSAVVGAKPLRKAAAKAAAPVAPNPANPAPPGLHDNQAKGRTPFEVDVTGAVRPGENVVALRVDHSRITELALGGDHPSGAVGAEAGVRMWRPDRADSTDRLRVTLSLYRAGRA